MTTRKILKEIRQQLEGMKPEERVTGIEITIVDASTGEGMDHRGPMIVGRMYVPVGANRGDTVTEMFDEGDPRRVLMEEPQ
mgnify:CR=1 FL=1